MFPVQIRFAPTHGRFEIVLCSPGEFSQNWIMLLVWKKGQEVSCIRSSVLFDSTVISHVLSLIYYPEIIPVSFDGLQMAQATQHVDVFEYW
ncbi:hypothetical protein QCD58_004544 [Enterobacter hormaechei]|nr:hypothetical protein [Enterobacter hormaechei]